MSWTDLPTNFKNLVWTGLKKYIKFDNPDQTISFEDVTEYEDTENTQMSAAVLNQITDALNQIMNGDLFYTESEMDIKLAEKASSTHNHDSVYLKLIRVALEFSTTKTYAVGDYVIYNGTLYYFTANHAAGAWTGSDATEQTVDDALKQIRSDISYEAINLLDKIRVVSTPHGMDRYFPVTRLEIPLDDPTGTIFTLGAKTGKTLTQRLNNLK